MKTIGVIFLTIIRFSITLFVGAFVFLVKMALRWR